MANDEARQYFEQGNRAYEVGQYEESIALYDKTIEIDPEFAGAYNNRGLSKAKLNWQQEAIRDYDKAIEINPEYAEAIHNRAVSVALLHAQGEQEKIKQKYEEQLKKQQQEFETRLDTDLSDMNTALGYDTTLKEMKEDYKSKSNWYLCSIAVLAVAAISFYGYAIYLGFEMFEKSDNPYGVFPFLTAATLTFFPLYLWVRSADRDKARALALREDIRSKRALTILVKYYRHSEGDGNQALFRLFDHHTHNGTPP